MSSPDNISTFVVFFTLISRKCLVYCYDYWKTLYSLKFVHYLDKHIKFLIGPR